MVNSDCISQEIIDHPWGAKGARRRGWVIVVSLSIFTVSSTTLEKPANRRRGSFRNGVISCFSSGDSAAYGERGSRQ